MEFYIVRDDKKKDSEELMHYGVDNMHWGDRRYQNKDGSLTPEGKLHYAELRSKAARRKKFDDQREARADIRRREEENKHYKQEADDDRHTYQLLKSVTPNKDDPSVNNYIKVSTKLTELGAADREHPWLLMNIGGVNTKITRDQLKKFVLKNVELDGSLDILNELKVIGRYKTEEDLDNSSDDDLTKYDKIEKIKKKNKKVEADR